MRKTQLLILISIYNILFLGICWKNLELRSELEVYKIRDEVRTPVVGFEEKNFLFEPSNLVCILGGCLLLGLTLYGVSVGVSIYKASFVGRLYDVTNAKAISLLEWWTAVPTTPVDRPSSAVPSSAAGPTTPVDVPSSAVDITEVEIGLGQILNEDVLTFVELTDGLCTWGCG
jgi:hypothetical protein